VTETVFIQYTRTWKHGVYKEWGNTCFYCRV